MANTRKTKEQIMAERAAAAKRKPEPLKPKVRKTQAQIDAELAAAKKEFEKYRATRPSKEKLAEMYNAQQSRIGRSKTAASTPAVRRTGVKPAPLGTPKISAPRRGNAAPVPLGTPAPRSTGRRPAMPKTTKKAPATAPKKQQKMTPQDAAMKKILEGKYGKIYG
jgi:hypothetical protein